VGGPESKDAFAPEMPQNLDTGSRFAARAACDI